ncbi:MAG: metallophosphoesterase [Gaiellales bacterium]|nr:MAG: metallophosphoesterase [Gaiellales bacterium]
MKNDNHQGTSGFWARRARRAVLITAEATIAAVMAFLTMILVAPTEVQVGPVLIGFEARPSWGGHTVVELPPAGSLHAQTHRAPVELVFTLKEIAVDQAADLTREGSAAREELRMWREPVTGAARMLLLRTAVAAALAAGSIAWLARRRWAWVAAGMALGLTVAAGLSLLVWYSYDLDAFSQPEYTGNLARAPEIVGFSHEFLANLETYSDQVPRIAENLYRTVNELQRLPDGMPLEDSIRVLHVSDLHNSEAGAALLQRVTGLYDIDFVIDTGDISELGTPFELGYPGTFLPLEVPYLWIAGNHDSGLVSETMAEIDGVTVLDGDFRTVEGLTVGGFPDPSAASLIPRVATGSELEEDSRMILAAVREAKPAPDIIAVHDPGQARRLTGVVPVVLSGHVHRDSIDVTDGTVLINAGSTGGGGLRGFEAEGETPSSLQVLYFNRSTHKIMAADTIVIYGFSQEYTVARQIFSGTDAPVPVA